MNLNELITYSEQLLLQVKRKEDSSSLQARLKDYEPELLPKSLIDDDKKKVFWINIYNAYFQLLRVDLKLGKPDIYTKKAFTIAGNPLSLDDVEHGILRRYRFKYSLGLFPQPFTSKFIKQNALDKLDYRIHFALNCGAKSCPPIAFYKPENIDQQLNLATQSFLENESEFDEGNKIVHTTTLFKWFYFDFGGKKGIKRIFAEQLNKDISDYKIKYTPYSWEEDLANFVN